MNEINWTNTILASKIRGLVGGDNVLNVYSWVRELTYFEYFIFNGACYKVLHDGFIDTGYRLDYSTYEIVKK